jgi:hypothetical protein
LESVGRCATFEEPMQQVIFLAADENFHHAILRGDTITP